MCLYLLMINRYQEFIHSFDFENDDNDDDDI